MRQHIDPNCKACSGKGRNSRGNPCAPCQVNGEPVPPERPVRAQANADGSIDVEGKAHHQCVGCEEWFPRGTLIVDNVKLPQADGKLRCGDCHRAKYRGPWEVFKNKMEIPPVRLYDAALEGFL